MSTYHIPVLLQECLDYLDVAPGKIILDGTMGGGGHSLAIAKAVSPDGLCIGVDRDSDALNEVLKREDFKGLSFKAVKKTFGFFPEAMEEAGVESIDGILLDIGVSSHQFDDGERGFSYRYNAPLDMRMDQTQGDSAAAILQNSSEEELEYLLRSYGEVQNARRMAKHIVVTRGNMPLETTGDFVNLLNVEYGDLKPAVLSKVFQAFRIAVNRELEQLEMALQKSLSHLSIGGRIAVISYHSLEDRIVKNFFRDRSESCYCPPQLPICQCGGDKAQLKIITRKAVVATESEISQNVRARSARLRVAERIR